jgi:hypothetical protein
MPNQINISSIIGVQPYKVYVCNTAFQNCVLVNSGLTGTSYSFLAPSPYDVVSQVGIKLIGSDGCEILSGITLSTQSITPQYEDQCFTFVYGSPVPTQTVFSLFRVNGTDNGKPVWSSTTLNNVYFKWIPVRSQWEFFNFGNNIVNRDSSNTPNPNSWNIVGTNTTNLTSVTSNPGSCPSYLPLSATLNISNVGCSNSNTGSISVIATGGVPGVTPNPLYQYSIDGVNFQVSNLFTNLTPNTYTIFVKDSMSNLFQIQGVVANTPNSLVSYSVSINTSNIVSIISRNTSTKSLDWVLNVVPSLPIGTAISFDLIVSDIQQSYDPGGAEITTSITVLKNNVQQSTQNRNVSTSTFNRAFSCSFFTVKQTGITETYNSINVGYGDTLGGRIVSAVKLIYPSNINGCLTEGDDIISLNIANLRINGCSCCSLNQEPVEFQITNKYTT